ncbi:MAG TPA: extracellular solute-binding protein [Anaerolineae bacterium]
MVELELSIMQHGSDPIGDIRPLLDQFEAEQHIHVRLTLLPWDIAWVELVKVALYGHGPDVSEIGTTWIGNLIAMNTLRPFAPAELDMLGGSAAFLPSSWQSSAVLGEREVCAVPWLADTRLIYYRRDLLDKAGVDVATAFNSPRQLASTLGRLSEHGIELPWVVPNRYAWNTLHNIASWVWGAGGDFVTAEGRRVIFDQPQARAGMKAYFELYRYLAPEARHLDGIQSDAFFLQRQVAVTITGPWLMLLNRNLNPGAVANWGVALPPGAPFVGGSNLVVWRHTQHEGDALKLVKFLTGKQSQVHNPRVGMLPVRLETLAEPSFTDNPANALMGQVVRAGRSFPSLRAWGLIEDKLSSAFTQVWAEILESPEPDVDALLGKYLPALAEQLNSTLNG